MAERVDVFYSLQSEYCYFLLDRLIALAADAVDVQVRPVLGGVLRTPDRYQDRDVLEQQYFETDTRRTAEYLGLPYAYPDPSPIEFESGSLWVARPSQPRNERLNRLFVGAVRAGQGLAFLDHVARMLWDGSTPGWNQGEHLARAMSAAGLDLNRVLATTPWDCAKSDLDNNAAAMLS
ncbi:MAG: hypothetical protein GY947_04680, partial [Rhodobacteraceae bacterium]|nr:hypothetical protein [Paracoccaceae bacterium]